jgi:hypothetical protein
LHANRPAAAGWGFNTVAGPDADSTAWALRLFSCLGEQVDDRDADFLLAKHRPEGGFATFDGPENWGIAHADVTPTVFLALPREIGAPLARDVIGYAAGVRAADGTWPSYWWRTCHYATFLNSELYDRLGVTDQYTLPVVTLLETQCVHTAFDLACVTGIAAVRSPGSAVLDGLIRELLRLQRFRGDWAGGANLRVTDPGCAEPWANPRGRLYVDRAGLLTTATAIRALAFTHPETSPQSVMRESACADLAL